VSQLLVDANGVLVLLKFLNQDFGKIEIASETDKNFPFLKVCEESSLQVTLEFAINSLLKLMYKTCKNQKERITGNLIHYKGYLIIKKLIARFTLPQLKKNAAKVIKIQIKYMEKRWRKTNMKIVSIPYSYVDLNITDEWLAFDSSPAEEAM